MKTLVAFTFATALTFGMISCGQSDSEKKADSAQLDSTKKEMDATGDHMIDSMNAANAAAEKQQHDADSVKMADSMAKMKKK